MSRMPLLGVYFDIQRIIYDYFGYIEDWKVLPIDDKTGAYWRVRSDSVIFSDTLKGLNNENMMNHYQNDIFRYVHLDKHVYRGKDFTMIIVDTNTDGNQFLQIFTNSREK